MRRYGTRVTTWTAGVFLGFIALIGLHDEPCKVVCEVLDLDYCQNAGKNGITELDENTDQPVR